MSPIRYDRAYCERCGAVYMPTAKTVTTIQMQRERANSVRECGLTFIKLKSYNDNRRRENIVECFFCFNLTLNSKKFAGNC